MKDQIKSQIGKLKQQVAEWPTEQKASFIGGISEGLCLAVLIAKEAGCNLAKEGSLVELADYLGGQKCPPVKRRNQAAQQPKPAKQQLFEDTKELVRRAIAGRLGISKKTHDTSWDAWDDVNQHLFTVIAIANRKALDDAIADLQILRSIAGSGEVDRESVKAEVEMCYEKFPIEIAAIERFNELSKRRNFQHQDIWAFLRSNTPVRLGHDDDELRELDARYQSAT